jgi:hypothetical protein
MAQPMRARRDEDFTMPQSYTMRASRPFAVVGDVAGSPWTNSLGSVGELPSYRMASAAPSKRPCIGCSRTPIRGAAMGEAPSCEHGKRTALALFALDLMLIGFDVSMLVTAL